MGADLLDAAPEVFDRCHAAGSAAAAPTSTNATSYTAAPVSAPIVAACPTLTKNTHREPGPRRHQSVALWFARYALGDRDDHATGGEDASERPGADTLRRVRRQQAARDHTNRATHPVIA